MPQPFNSLIRQVIFALLGSLNSAFFWLLLENTDNPMSNTPASMGEGGRRGNSFYLSQKKAIKFSKYLSEAQKHRLLEWERQGTGLDQRRKRDLAGQIEGPEGKQLAILPDTEVVTGRMFGQPIIHSFSKMLSEFYGEKHGGGLKDVNSLFSCVVLSVPGDSTQCTKWLHLNFRAKLKDDDSSPEKLYFAEVIVFVFRCALSQCCVTACLCADSEGDDSGNRCKCIFSSSCDITHPTPEAYNADSLEEPYSSEPLLSQARREFEDLTFNKRRNTGRVWLFNPRRGEDYTFTIPPVTRKYLDLRFSKRRNLTSAPASPETETETVQKYMETSTRMSKDVPLPKEIGLSKGKRQGSRRVELKGRALAMAKRIENCRKPRERKQVAGPLLETFLMVLPYCYRKKYGFGLEALDGLRCCEGLYIGDHEQGWRIFHVNFTARHKEEKKPFFAEVARLSSIYADKWVYRMIACYPVGENDPAGNSSECGSCKNCDIQTAKKNLSQLFELEEDNVTVAKMGIWF